MFQSMCVLYKSAHYVSKLGALQMMSLQLLPAYQQLHGDSGAAFGSTFLQ